MARRRMLVRLVETLRFPPQSPSGYQNEGRALFVILSPLRTDVGLHLRCVRALSCGLYEFTFASAACTKRRLPVLKRSKTFALSCKTTVLASLRPASSKYSTWVTCSFGRFVCSPDSSSVYRWHATTSETRPRDLDSDSKIMRFSTLARFFFINYEREVFVTVREAWLARISEAFMENNMQHSRNWKVYLDSKLAGQVAKNGNPHASVLCNGLCP